MFSTNIFPSFPKDFDFEGRFFSQPSTLIRWFKKHPSRSHRLDRKKKKGSKRA